MTEPQRALRVARSFRLSGSPAGAERLGSGHINDTFVVRCDTGPGGVAYVLQRINPRVFRDPRAVAENAARITASLRAGLERRGVADLSRRCLRCVEALSGELVLQEGGESWRAFERIEGARTFEVVESTQQARRAARAFGQFSALLADLDPASLHVTIPGFHDFEARADALERAATHDPVGRAAGASLELLGMRAARERLDRALAGARLASLPIRVVHNDCKLNNVLFDEATGEALCVIDLDTAMPGSLLADFGDLVRTAACREPEDSRALDRVRVESDLYAALAEGYLEGVAPVITLAERSLLPLAGPLITLETGLRFLTDHLEGDHYFRIAREGHNLDRARTQLRLSERLLDDLDEARRVIERIGQR